jgi:DNA-directed RNA polymerase specialized sigma24 family protein
MPSTQPTVMEPAEELVRLMVLQLRRASSSQAEAISELRKAGFGPSRIAELLGTTVATVNKDLQRAKKPARRVNVRPSSE